MIKVLADKVLAFDRGEKNGDGQVVSVKTNIGFCELPDWVAKTDYFKAATKDGSLKAFTSPSEPEAVLKEQEKLAAIRAEIAALEEKRDLMVKGDSDGGDRDSGPAGPDIKLDKMSKTKDQETSKTKE